jgi:hypothetical protein
MHRSISLSVSLCRSNKSEGRALKADIATANKIGIIACYSYDVGRFLNLAKIDRGRSVGHWSDLLHCLRTPKPIRTFSGCLPTFKGCARSESNCVLGPHRALYWFGYRAYNRHRNLLAKTVNDALSGNELYGSSGFTHGPVQSGPQNARKKYANSIERFCRFTRNESVDEVGLGQFVAI